MDHSETEGVNERVVSELSSSLTILDVNFYYLINLVHKNQAIVHL